jgi:VanZ family protein
MRRQGFATYVLPVILYCALIFFISSLPAPPAPDFGFDFSDKINHTGAYGIMMLLAFRASRWLMPESSVGQQIVRSLLFTLLYGASDEFHQSFVPNRECELFDWLADALGGILGGLFIYMTHRVAWLGFIYGRSLDGRAEVPT